MKIWLLLVILGFFSLSFALYNECSKERSFGSLDEKVNVSGCRKTYCRLKKNRSTLVQFRFTPDKDVAKVMNSISAQIGGIPFPFIGVDGTDATEDIFEINGKTKASFPLKAGTTYRFKRSINVLSVYPSIRVIVHWALKGSQGDLMCFEVPARIIN